MMDIRKIGSLYIIVYLLGWGILTAVMVLMAVYKQWVYLVFVSGLWVYMFHALYVLYRRNVKKVAFMFDAIDNADYAFKYATEHASPDDLLVNESLNRITQILFQARKDAQQREKYYELIINSVNTGIIVVDEKGNVYQTNQEALHLLGLTVFTHILQLQRIDEGLLKLVKNIQPGEKHQISFPNERGIIHLSIRASGIKLKDTNVRILAINDIDSELDENELDSWIRLTRVLTHEIMNSITPITSLSETLLSKEGNSNLEIRNGLKVICATGKGLMDFVENYRKFTHIPTPVPSLFYINNFAGRMKQLALHQIPTANITITINVEPLDLIVYADENLITRVILNLLKNAMQAIGKDQSDGEIGIKAYCNKAEAVFIEITNNGPLIPTEEIEHIFVPFFTTKSNGSGIGLSISRQIMRLSGGTLSLRSDAQHHLTTFTLMFP
jgi:nitrogen fixation/metabolism regulation signal transduction histidine kinase